MPPLTHRDGTAGLSKEVATCMCDEQNMDVFVCKGGTDGIIRYGRDNKGRNPASCVNVE